MPFIGIQCTRDLAYGLPCQPAFLVQILAMAGAKENFGGFPDAEVIG
jgi:hypothetical protein